jgi:hypothetical protein
MFPVASKALIEERILQKRTDTKFVIQSNQLASVLEELKETCAAITHNGQIESDYKNLYFDTTDFRCLLDHQRGRRPRFKARFRHHVSRELSFFEIKKRCRDERTEKFRLDAPFMHEQLTDTEMDFVTSNTPLKATKLQPTIGIEFKRITLVTLLGKERITLDTQLRFVGSECSETWPELAIIEVKQARLDPQTPSMKALKKAGATEFSISKYCLGASLVLPKADTNWYGHKIHFLRTRLNG